MKVINGYHSVLTYLVRIYKNGQWLILYLKSKIIGGHSSMYCPYMSVGMNHYCKPGKVEDRGGKTKIDRLRPLDCSKCCRAI